MLRVLGERRKMPVADRRMLNRRGAEETTLSAGFLIKLVIAALVLLSVFLLSIRLIDLITQNDGSYSARRNMHLLADRVVEDAHELVAQRASSRCEQ